MSNYLSALGEKRYKPDLVAPGSAVVGSKILSSKLACLCSLPFS